MLKDIIKIREEIFHNGGEHSAHIWDAIISNFENHFNDKDFNAESFLHQVWSSLKPEKDSDKIDNIKKSVISKIGGDNINLIPSDKTGPCKPICLSIASGTFGEKHYPNYGKIGFKGMMLKLVACWFNCLSTNQETLILTKDWKQNEFDELYKPVFEAYCSTHRKKAFIVVVTNTRAFLAYSI